MHVSVMWIDVQTVHHTRNVCRNQIKVVKWMIPRRQMVLCSAAIVSWHGVKCWTARSKHRNRCAQNGHLKCAEPWPNTFNWTLIILGHRHSCQYVISIMTILISYWSASYAIDDSNAIIVTSSIRYIFLYFPFVIAFAFMLADSSNLQYFSDIFQEVSKIESLVANDGIAINVGITSIGCKLCRYYINMLMKPQEGKKGDFLKEHRKR